MLNFNKKKYVSFDNLKSFNGLLQSSLKEKLDGYKSETDAKVQKKFNELSGKVQTDSEVIDARKGEASLRAKIDVIDENLKNVDSQLEHIATLANDNIQEKLNNGGHIKIIGNIELNSTLYVKDNTILEMDTNSKITSNFNGVVLQVEGNNVEIRNVNIDCNNNTCTGIFVNSNAKDVLIRNNTVKNSNGGSSKPVYGIFVSSIGCKNITIDNNVIDNIVSLGDGSLGNRDGGWAKGIAVDLYDLIDLPNDVNQNNISNNITISNNQISNILDESDADGIYIEGYRPSLKNNITIENNSLYNCYKRFIKILNTSNVRILNNYGYNEEHILMHSHISLYSSENTVSGNNMNANSRYGVELGYQTKYEDYLVKNIVIENNVFNIRTVINYGACISKPDYDGFYRDIIINNNILSGGNKSILLKGGGDVESIKITNNTCTDLIGAFCFISVEEVNIDKFIVENNRFITDSKANNIISIYPSDENFRINTCIIDGNISSESIYSSYNIKSIDNLILTDNKITSNTAYQLYNVNNNIIKNNYNLSTGLPCEVEIIKTFDYKTISTSSIDLNISNMTQVNSLKLMPSVSTTLNTLVGELGQIVNLINIGNAGFTINHTNDIHLKNGISVTLNSLEQCITLIKLDNRWLEISRNF